MASPEKLGELKMLEVIKFLKKHNFPTVRAGELGYGLGLDHHIIEEFTANNPTNPSKVLMDVINYWLDNDLKASWNRLAEALDSCGYGNAARSITGSTESPSTDTRPEFCFKSFSMLKVKTDGKIEKFRLLEEICNRWQDMGNLIGLGPGRLVSIETTRMKDPKKCCSDVFGDWINQGKGEGEYEPTWEGLVALLRDVQLNSAADQLKEALRQ